MSLDIALNPVVEYTARSGINVLRQATHALNGGSTDEVASKNKHGRNPQCGAPHNPVCLPAFWVELQRLCPSLDAESLEYS